MSERSENPILVSERSRESETQRIRRLKQEIRQKKGELRDALSGLEPEQREPAGDVAGLKRLATVLAEEAPGSFTVKQTRETAALFFEIITRHLGEREQAPAPGDADPTLEKALGLAPLKRKSLEKMVYPAAEPTEEPALSDRELHHIWRNAPVGSALDTAVRLLTEARTRLAALEDAILWALGEQGAFPLRQDGEGMFWWRKKLRALAGPLRASLRAEPGADEGEEG